MMVRMVRRGMVMMRMRMMLSKDFTNDLSSSIIHNCFKIVSIGLHHTEEQ